MSKKFRFKNRVALCLAGSVFLGTAGLPSISVAAMEGQSRFLDTKGHWASDAIERMSEYELVNGYNGLFRPSDPITRGEMSIIIDHIMGYQKEADNIFIDLE
ncbi:MAG: S-layer homology domain-containing protein, partial [Zhenhengia sp.]